MWVFTLFNSKLYRSNNQGKDDIHKTLPALRFLPSHHPQDTFHSLHPPRPEALYPRCDQSSGRQGARDEESAPDPEKAREDAQALFDAGEAKWGTDEEVFNRILAHESFAQLRLVFEEYKNISGRTIEQAIKAEVGGELKEALSAIVECVENAAAWFAARLRSAMQGAGTEDQTLIRIIVGRAEVDLQSIKEEYERLYDKTLESDLKGETSGDYKRALVALLGPA